MKIGVLLLKADPFETVEKAIEFGFESVEIVLENYIDALDRKDIEELNLKCCQNKIMFAVHAPSTDLNIGSFNNGIKIESIRQLTKTIDLVGGIAEYITFHTGYLPKFKRVGSLERVIESLKKISAHALEKNVILCIENIHENSISQLLDYRFQSNCPNLKFTLDIAHIPIYSNFNPVIGIEVLFEYIKNIHISDNDGINDLHLSVGSGKIEFISTIKRLIEKSYKSTITIEALNIEDAIKSRRYIREKIANIKIKTV